MLQISMGVILLGIRNFPYPNAGPDFQRVKSEYPRQYAELSLDEMLYEWLIHSSSIGNPP
jgi:hypothetical protein